MLKRVFDIVLSITLLLVLSPVIALVAAAVAVSMGGPVIFSQVRPGLYGKPFMMYKFRTMLDLFDSEGKPLPDEKRITPLGCFLRKTSLDELPELWNVLRGDMSMVGPRPLRMEYLPLYSPQQMRRHEVRPGITGWAQVNGRNAITWEKRFDLDVWYVEHRSFWLDMRILLMTVLVVLKGHGISAENHVTMPRFRGTSADGGL